MEKAYVGSREVTVLQVSPNFVQIDDEKGPYWIKKELVTDAPAAAKPKASRGFKPVKPETFRLSPMYQEFEDFLRKEATLRIQLPPQSTESFIAKYRSVAGESVDAPSDHVSVIVPTAKWGITSTILFPSSGKPLVPSWLTAFQYSQSTPDVIGICDNDFFWELISKGFRLGRQKEEAAQEAN